jgi:nucleoside-diphosphate-sugar epimerase
MSDDTTRVLVTGASGCIGSVTVRDLLALGASQVVAASRSGAPGSLGLWLEDLRDPRLAFAAVDVGEREAVLDLVRAMRPTHIVHLGALQSPDCDADPERGLRVNVGGTLHLLDAAAAAGGLRRFVFASSAAVYGRRDRYPGATVREGDELAPPNLYGVWKLTGEQLLRQFHERSGVPVVCLRLNTTYGKGRDRGKTSAPTRAIKAVALGAVSGTPVPFRMPYSGRENYHFVADVGAHFARCTLDPFAGFGAFNIRGETVPVAEFLQRIEQAAAGLGAAADLGFAEDATDNPFVCDLDESAIRARFADLPRTALEVGIDATLRAFLRLAEQGALPY